MGRFAAVLLNIRARLRGAWFDFCHRKDKAAQDDVCMCGDNMRDHNPYWSNHAPVSVWEYTRSCYIAEGQRK